LTRNTLIFLAAGGSLALLAGAFVFQAMGYPPCAMCLWQRWPHVAAILVGIVAIGLPHRLLPLLGALAAAVTAGIGVYHTGVERGFWEGPSSCTTAGGGLSGISGDALLSFDGPLLVLCDTAIWHFLTLSMASWNAILSLGLVALWLMATRNWHRG
jgi:disulfide bond formation protein DsbB